LGQPRRQSLLLIGARLHAERRRKRQHRSLIKSHSKRRLLLVQGPFDSREVYWLRAQKMMALVPPHVSSHPFGQMCPKECVQQFRRRQGYQVFWGCNDEITAPQVKGGHGCSTTH